MRLFLFVFKQEGSTRKTGVSDTPHGPEATRGIFPGGNDDWCSQEPFLDRSEYYHVTPESDPRAEGLVRAVQRAAGGEPAGHFVVRKSLSEPAECVSVTYVEAESDEVYHMKVTPPPSPPSASPGEPICLGRI